MCLSWWVAFLRDEKLRVEGLQGGLSGKLRRPGAECTEDPRELIHANRSTVVFVPQLQMATGGEGGCLHEIAPDYSALDGKGSRVRSGRERRCWTHSEKILGNTGPD